MWTKEVVDMILKGIQETLYMTLLSTLMGYVIGLPMGVLLAVSDKDGLKPNRVLYRILDVIANIVRSIPFLILLILLIPFTRMIVGKSYGSWEDERAFVCTVGTLAETAKKNNITKTALMIIGDVVTHSHYNRSELYNPAFTTEFREATK